MDRVCDGRLVVQAKKTTTFLNKQDWPAEHGRLCQITEAKKRAPGSPRGGGCSQWLSGQEAGSPVVKDGAGERVVDISELN